MYKRQTQLMDADLLDDIQEQQLRDSVASEVDQATREAEQSPFPEPEDLYKHVYFDEC